MKFHYIYNRGRGPTHTKNLEAVDAQDAKAYINKNLPSIKLHALVKCEVDCFETHTYTDRILARNTI